MPRRSVLTLVAALVASLLPASRASATLSEALSLPELVAEARIVVLAEVLDQRARRDRLGRIVTDVRLRVVEPLKGRAQAGAVLTVLRLGGVLGDLGSRVEGEPSFEDGARYVLFLRPLADGALRPVAMSQGVLPVRGDLVHPGGAGLRLVRRDAQGHLVGARGALTAPVPLADLRAQIRALSGGGAPTLDPAPRGGVAPR